MRRKGEKKLAKQWQPWGDGHPVARAMRTGSSWWTAWTSQACTPWPQIERRTGITIARMFELDRGADPSADELAALAKLWNCPVADLTDSRKPG